MICLVVLTLTFVDISAVMDKSGFYTVIQFQLSSKACEDRGIFSLQQNSFPSNTFWHCDFLACNNTE